MSDGRTLDASEYADLSEPANVLGKLFVRLGQAYEAVANRNADDVHLDAFNRGRARAYYANVKSIPAFERESGDLGGDLWEFNERLSAALAAAADLAENEPGRTTLRGEASGHHDIAAIVCYKHPTRAFIDLIVEVEAAAKPKRRLFGRR